MQEILVEAILIAAFATGVGVLSSMTGIGGGTVNTPLLIIIFGLSAQIAPASALVAALFVAVASSASYWRQNPRPTIPRVGLLLAVTTVPGSLLGVAMRTLISDDMVLRVIFGVSLIPVALKMLFAKRKTRGDLASEIAAFDMNSITRKRWAVSLIGAFIGGISAGLLGIGGGAVVVPVLSILVGLPMHAAVATSMFTMMFTASSGTIMNYLSGHIDPFYAISLGLGMLVGGQIGSKLACRVNAVQIKWIFGIVLVLPLVKMMSLGQMWLDPTDSSFLMATLGDILIWLMIVLPIGLFRLYQIRQSQTVVDEEPCETPG
ncbi:MAG: hypothetical protein DRP09_13225 [Candidatus Thorarchaeota archaeon]|nr:MAG: hypothetical protein DRP09_13225 [Candidatus Thorarchaeota archaeon]